MSVDVSLSKIRFSQIPSTCDFGRPKSFRRVRTPVRRFRAEVADAQDAAKVQPQAYRVAFENDKLRVLDYNSRPGMGVCGNGMHSHPAHLTVVVSGGSVRIKTPDGKTVEQHDIPVGVVFWSEAETHNVENISGSNMRSLIIELKTGKA